METLTAVAPDLSLALASTPGVMWAPHDDLCNCVFQRIGFWTNPYMGATMLVRLCCMWQKLDEMFPGMVQEIPAFFDYNEGHFVESGPQEWDSPDSDMPRAIWYRHIAAKTGDTLADVRAEYADKEPPQRVG